MRIPGRGLACLLQAGVTRPGKDRHFGVYSCLPAGRSQLRTLRQTVKQHGLDKRAVLFQGNDLPAVIGKEVNGINCDRTSAAFGAVAQAKPLPGGVKYRELKFRN